MGTFKRIWKRNIWANCAMIVLLGGFVPGLLAQETDPPSQLSFLEAIDRGARENHLVKSAMEEFKAAESERLAAKDNVWPRITANGGYQRFTKVQLYEGVLGESHQITKPPNANAGNLGLESYFNLYSGKKQQSAIQLAGFKSELAALDQQDRVAMTKLEVAQHYLDLVRIYHLKKLAKEQIVRAERRLLNIRSLYDNGKVTKSDLLRADLMLSQVALQYNSAENDYRIGNEKLNVLLDFPNGHLIVPTDTTAFVKVDSVAIRDVLEKGEVPFPVQKSGVRTAVAKVQTKLAKGDNLPSVGLVGAYGLNYPNNLVFPPQDQTLGVGFIGAKVTYDLSSLYRNGNKVKAAKFRERETELDRDYIEKQIAEQKQGLYFKYLEALNRIAVTEKSIEQAKANYKIINTKYFNQLALLTDLLDADNLYQQTKYDFILAHINAVAIYYKILYLTVQI